MNCPECGARHRKGKSITSCLNEVFNDKVFIGIIDSRKGSRRYDKIKERYRKMKDYYDLVAG